MTRQSGCINICFILIEMIFRRFANYCRFEGYLACDGESAWLHKYSCCSAIINFSPPRYFWPLRYLLPLRNVLILGVWWRAIWLYKYSFYSERNEFRRFAISCRFASAMVWACDWIFWILREIIFSERNNFSPLRYLLPLRNVLIISVWWHDHVVFKIYVLFWGK